MRLLVPPREDARKQCGVQQGVERVVCHAAPHPLTIAAGRLMPAPPCSPSHRQLPCLLAPANHQMQIKEASAACATPNYAVVLCARTDSSEAGIAEVFAGAL
jgi:hypothetical protein